MKKTTLLLCIALLFASAGIAQSVTLTFTGRDGGNHHLELEYVAVTNVTKGWQEYLFWPDTVLTIQAETGIQDVETMSGLSLRMSPHSPNPFNGSTDVILTVEEEGIANLEIADMNGRVVWANDYNPLPGVHQFRVALAHAGIYVMTARHNGKISSIKMVCNKGENVNTVEYVGAAATDIRETMTSKYHTRGLVTRPFDIGDQMQYVGYAIINYEEEESQCVERPLTDSQFFVLPFSSTQLGLPTVITANVTNITDNSVVCGGQVTDDGGDTMAVRGVCVGLLPSPTVLGRHTVDGHGMGAFSSQLTRLSSNFTYYVRAYVKNDQGIAYGEDRTFTIPVNPDGDVWSCPDAPLLTDIDGNVYNTVQIGQQCWMRENLRTTRYADGTLIPQGEDFSTTVGYRYRPMNDSSLVSNYGLLYNWVAVIRGMSGSTATPIGVQGICPDGWHVPNSAECMQLFQVVESQGQNLCDGLIDQIAKSLAATVGWDWSGFSDTCVVGNANMSGNNSTGFSAIPAGFYTGDNTGPNYGGLGYVSFYWTSTGSYTSNFGGSNYIHYWRIHANDAAINYSAFYDEYGDAQSVRCVKD